MNIILIQPEGVNSARFSIDNLREEEGILPPLGLLYIASFIKKYSKHKIEVLDNQINKLRGEVLYDFIKQRNPDLVGITCRSYYLYDTLNIAKIIKSVSKKIITVIGGHHTFIFPQETISFPEVDYIALGEGEFSFYKLLEYLSGSNHNGNLLDYGIIDKENVKENIFKKQIIEDLDNIPFPDRQLTDYTKYFNIMTKEGPTTSLISSRGCPFSCSFCTSRQEEFRGRSALNVVSEIEYCLSLGIKEISMVDDNFTVNLKRVEDICDLIILKGLKFRWDIKGRIDNINKTVLEKLFNAGCRRIQYGIETPNKRIQKILNKNIDVNKIRSTLIMTKEIGFETYADFMIGSPTETKDEILNTIKMAKEYRLDYAHFGITMLMPGTPMYEQEVREYNMKDMWKEYALNPTPNFFVPYSKTALNRKQLENLLALAYRSFYLRPVKVIKNLIYISSWDEMKRKINTARKILFKNISSQK
jgi:radical SAM superfamily enzyme YgiQ (UPF0313 family)